MKKRPTIAQNVSVLVEYARTVDAIGEQEATASLQIAAILMLMEETITTREVLERVLERIADRT